MSRFPWIVALIVLAVPAWSLTEPVRFALVIGNATYDGDAKLFNPINDASEMSQSLASIGWNVTQVLDGDRSHLNSAIDAFQEKLKAEPGSVALMYYAGHGMQINGQNYLIPVHETIETVNDVLHNGIPMADFENVFEEAQVSTSIVIMDACRDNPFGKKSTRSLGVSRGLSVVSRATSVGGSAVLFATAPGETASDGQASHGIFTQALLKYLKTDLKLQDFVTKVTADVKAVSMGRQLPYNSLSLSEDFYLVPAALRASTTSSAVSRQVATIDVLPTASYRSRTDALPVLGWLGVGTGAAAGGVAVWQYLAGASAYGQYLAATEPNVALSLHNQVVTSALIWQVSAAAAGILVGSGLVALVWGGSL